MIKGLNQKAEKKVKKHWDHHGHKKRNLNVWCFADQASPMMMLDTGPRRFIICMAEKYHTASGLPRSSSPQGCMIATMKIYARATGNNLLKP